MQDSGNNPSNLQDLMSNTFRNLANVSLKAYRPAMDVMVNSMSTLNKSVMSGNLAGLRLPMLNADTCHCCPPKCECPPHCIAAIERCASHGERIVVPFIVKNTCSHAKAWRVGVRELKDQDGKLAPEQPQLNKQVVLLEPGRSERVLMMLDLQKFQGVSGTYTTEIVLREQNINQNICFTLHLNDDCDVVTAEPKDEQKIQMHWQSWQSHYYCEPKQTQTPIPKTNG